MEEGSTSYMLENILCDTSAEPTNLPLSLFQEITENFSDKRKIGHGGFGVIYKGVLRNGMMVAVKKLSDLIMEDKSFREEVSCLMRAKHKNVVRFLGYCADTQGIMTWYNGKYVLADQRVRLLCFEYVRNSSLEKHLTNEFTGLGWHERYRVIIGICEGLRYLHEEEKITHLDLRPANILLDDSMVPKITDFGLSRLFDKEQSRIITNNCHGSFGYMAPEYLGNGIISFKADIYSLGMTILEIITGTTEQPRIEDAYDNWMKRLHEESSLSLDVYCQQVKICIEIALNCVVFDINKRPGIGDIVCQLNDIETTIHRESLCSNEPGTSTEQDKESIPVSKRNIIFRPSLDGEQMAEAITVAVTKIITTLEEVANTEIFGRVNTETLPRKLKEVQEQLITLENVTKEVGMIHLTEKVVKFMVGEFRKVSYHVEDAADKYRYHHAQIEDEGSLKYAVKESHYAAVLNEIYDDLTRIEEEIQRVIKLKQRLSSHPSQRVPRFFSRLTKDEDLVGIEDNKLKLTAWIHSGESDNTVITVFGMAGIGKTTLVRNVYEQEKINFAAHAWIIVSQTYNVEDLLRKLRNTWYTMQGRLVDKDDEMSQKQRNKENPNCGKCLIVLDDVWDRQVYIQMRDAFWNLQAICTIITTRSKHVATLALPTHRLEIQPLDEADAFSLFCIRAFYYRDGKRCPNDLEKLAKSITERCNGLPPTITFIGRLLSSMVPTEHAWNQIHKQISTDLAKTDHVQAILNLRYYELPRHLRNCFMYCGMFPEGYHIRRESLVRLWVAEGFAVQEGGNTPEDVADGYLTELIHCNILEVVERDELGSASACKMHDIVRELALSVAKEERFGSSNGHGTIEQIGHKEVRRLSTHGREDERPCRTKFQHLRTIISLSTSSICLGTLATILSMSNYLTVLEPQDSEITQVTESIGDLFNLRYIGLRRTKVKSLPESISKLCSLTTLDMKSTKIEELPHGIGKVTKLRHLFANRPNTYVDGDVSVAKLDWSGTTTRAVPPGRTPNS